MGEIIMPKVGDAMTEGKVVRWYKKAGDAVKVGEPVLEIETDKVNLDLEAEDDGTLENVVVKEGETVEVGKRLAYVRAEGEEAQPESAEEPKKKKEADETEGGDDEESRPAGKKGGKKEDADEEENGDEEDAAPDDVKTDKAAAKEKAKPRTEEKPSSDDSGNGERPKSSPLARRIASDLGVDLGSLRGSGPAGRIIAADVQNAAKAAPAPGKSRGEAKQPRDQKPAPRPESIESKEIPLTAMRRTIAKRLSESLGPIPHFFLTIEADVTTLLSLRQQLNEIEQAKASVNDFVVRAAALALLHHPVVNSSFSGESINQHGEVHIGIAVATPEGLITPVVRNADQRSVIEIAGEIRLLAEKAKNRKLKPDEYQSGTFTISNLGMFGIEEFTAIINPPNAAILAVGAAGPKPVVSDGQIVVRDRMRLTLSCDHRVIDGAAGAQFMQTLQQYLEQPLRLLV
ncbi:MAG TPA: dihydrolipoamide acetyltransferase family protein [Thermoanaerobaculia bacterium]|nr:dihydrolipoamide acetyltransferase family protein [Thermoanaerobaculia bacterium]